MYTCQNSNCWKSHHGHGSFGSTGIEMSISILSLFSHSVKRIIAFLCRIQTTPINNHSKTIASLSLPRGYKT